MKRLFLIMAFVSLLLAGCSQLDTYWGEISHFFHDGESTAGNENVTPKENNLKEEADNEKAEEDPLTLEAAFFNNVQTVNGKKVIQNPANIMVLVNKEFSLPDVYTPDDLVRPKVSFSFGNQDLEKSYMRKESASALEAMFEDAKHNGIELFAVSGYRSYVRQSAVFDAEVNRVGEEKAVQAVAIPGSSEHQTGLTMDISSKSVNLTLSEDFGNKAEGKWLAENAHRFGFILRYPKGKEEITGYQFEPWHFRYVGKDAAAVIFEKKWTLEEYFNIVKKI